MNQHEWEQIEKIVDRALSLKGEERRSYIDEACNGDTSLKSKVFELLDNIEEAENKDYLGDIDRYADLVASEYDEDSHSLIGKQVGSYEILELIEHGGMASVYLAKRADEAYDAVVALKVMRRGMDTPTNIARFKRERNILARLDHTNIARLFDGGVTDDGLPYLVMEYVEGTPLIEYCSKNRLSIEKRLNLFSSICEAVEYAHKNAIIHRDLKPSNILITEEGQVKVLDFGIAKLLNPDETENTRIQTQEKSRILTPGYAAPEQISGESITTTTDVYALGVLLNELLIGVHPFDFEGKKLAEIERIIRDQSPDKPSIRYEALKETNQSRIAAARKTDTRSLAQMVKGDLDAIVLKSLRKEADQRYGSAEQMLADLRRRERDEPLVAREDTFRYQGQKFIKRHKNGLVTTVATLLLILGIVGYYTMQLSEQRNKAQLEAQKAEQVTTFLTDLIESNYPENAQGDTITVRQFLEKGYDKVQQLNRSPAVQVNIMQVMAHTYHSLGELEKASSLITRVVEMQDTISIKKTEIANTYNLYGLILRDQGEIKQAEEAMEESMKVFQNAGMTGSAKFANLLRDLAYIKRINGNYDEAMSLAERAIKIEKRLFGENNVKSAETYYVMGSISRYQNKFEQSKQYHLNSLEIVESNVDGPHPGKETNYNNLAIIYEIQDSLHKAETYYRKALSMSRKMYDDNHSELATVYSNLSSILIDEGKIDSAEILLKKALQIRRENASTGHPDMAENLRDYAYILKLKRDYEEADSMYTRALDILHKKFESDHPMIATVTYSKAINAYEMGRSDVASKLLKEVLEIRKERYERTDDEIQEPLSLLVKIIRQDQSTEMESLHKKYTQLQLTSDTTSAE